MRITSRHRSALSGRKASAPEEEIKDRMVAMEQGSEAEKLAVLIPVC